MFTSAEDFRDEDASQALMKKYTSEAPVLFVCLSPAFFRNKFCFAEVSAAVHARVPVSPIVVGEVYPGTTWKKLVGNDYFADN